MTAKTRGLPCLAVPDVAAAVTYYETYLGFRTLRTSAEPPSALVARDGSTILLRHLQETDPERAGGGRIGSGFDVVIPVPDLDSAFEELGVKGVSVRSPPSAHALLGRTFTIQDRFGHALGFMQAPSTPLNRVRRTLRSTANRVRAERFSRAALAELRPELKLFSDFYERLDNKRDIFYMFFTGGLMHWAAKAASHVPSDVNLVLIGSNLSTEEKLWAAENIQRPLHHMALHVNDWPIWDFLFDVNRSNFGWLDIDCLVLDEQVFHDLTKVPDDASVNSLWSYDSGFGFRVANTYLAFINVDAIASLRSRGIPVWARPHDWRGGDRSAQAGKKCHYRIPSSRERRLMLDVVPADHLGRPRPPGSHPFFDTLSVYQILARANGFHIHQVRDLPNPMLDAVPLGDPPSLEPQGMSDELIHVGGISYYQAFFHDPAIRIRYLAADHSVLKHWAPGMPAPYVERLNTVEAELEGFGISPEAADRALREHLLTSGGLSLAAVTLALGPAPAAATEG